MDRPELARHNVVATFPDAETAHAALSALLDAGVDRDHLELLTRQDIEGPEGAMPSDEPAQEHTRAGAVGLGAAAGGIAGFLAGAVAFGIPGVGPVIGTGLWVATLGGAAVGATAGGLSGGFSKMSEVRYLEALEEGKALLGVHLDDEDALSAAIAVVRQHQPLGLDHLDERGELLRTE